MSDTRELYRLVVHAADRLAEENGLTALHSRAFTSSMSSETHATHSQYIASAAASMAYAEAMLRMVAACLVVDEQPAGQASVAAPPRRVRAPAAEPHPHSSPA